MSKKASVIAIMLTLSFVAAALAIAADTRAVDDRTAPIPRRDAQAQTDLQSMERIGATSRLAGDSRSDLVPSHAVVQDQTKAYTADEVAYYLSADDLVYIRPGLNITIQSVTIPADRRPVVTFQMTDDKGQPLDRAGVLTPGSVSTSFILCYLPPTTKGEVTDYVAYTTRSQKSPITNVTAIQAGTDSPAGTYTPSGLNDGVYTYRFTTVLPANYNTTATHTLGIYATRNLTEFGLTLYVSNVTKDWVPSGAAVTQKHQVVLTSSCNQCHDPLALHGSTGRRNVEICILCHNPGVIDPDTGNTVDMKVMVHKIHMGKTLPSVVAGGHYIIIGNQGSVNDYSEIGYPQDIRNCDTCHQGAPQVNAWNLQPTIEACGSCHDDVNFATGAKHAAGAYPDNSKCAECHLPQGQLEYDPSVIGAHTVPYKSNQLLYPQLNVLSISNAGPGQNPTVQFKITDKNGNAMDPAKFGGSLGRFSANLAGPTTDYTTRITETIAGATSVGGGAYSYTFKTIKIPADAQGTWAMEFEGRMTTTIIKNGVPTDTIAQRDAMDNVVKFFAVTGTTVVPRRPVVSLANCNKCHEKLQLHGSNRNQIEACVVCHNPTLTAGTAAAGSLDSVSMQVMVHKIHTGEELNNDYIVGNANFKEVLYPGDRKNCAACHVGNSYKLPLPSTNVAVATPGSHFYWTPMLPATTACLTCHDSTATAAHAFINTTTLGGISIESCEVCHKESADFAVTKVHAR